MTRCDSGGCTQPAAPCEFFDFRGQGYSVRVRALCLWCAYAIRLIRLVRQAAKAAKGSEA